MNYHIFMFWLLGWSYTRSSRLVHGLKLWYFFWYQERNVKFINFLITWIIYLHGPLINWWSNKCGFVSYFCMNQMKWWNGKVVGLFLKKYLLSNQRGGSLEKHVKMNVRVNSSHDTARGQICCIGETHSYRYIGSFWWAWLYDWIWI